MPKTDETCPFCGTAPNDGERMCATREDALLASSWEEPLGCPWLSNDDRLRLSNEVRAALRAAQHTPADAPAPQAEPAPSLDDVRREAEKLGMTQGILIACTTLLRTFDQPTIAKEILAEAGITEDEVLQSGLSEFDTNESLPIVREIARERAAYTIRAAAAADPVRGEGETT